MLEQITRQRLNEFKLNLAHGYTKSPGVFYVLHKILHIPVDPLRIVSDSRRVTQVKPLSESRCL